MYKHPVLLSKMLEIVVIFLFIGILTIPEIIAVDNDTESVNESIKDSDEIRIPDEYEEIITYIEGYAELNWINQTGKYRGEAEIIKGDFTGMCLWGIRRSNGGLKIFIECDAVYVYTPRFIGETMPSIIFEPYTHGLAFGNIDWYS